MADKHDEILACVQDIDRRVGLAAQETSRRLEIVEKAVFGNGREGLKTTVTKLRSESGIYKHYVSMFVGAVIVAAVGSWLQSRNAPDDNKHPKTPTVAGVRHSG